MAGRPREFDREQALLKARNLFWRQGYEGTSMSDLVAELGIASARIYKAFGSKEQLFREAIASYEAEEGGFADRAFAQESGEEIIVDGRNHYPQDLEYSAQEASRAPPCQPSLSSPGRKR